MTKRNLFLFLIFMIIVGVLYFFQEKKDALVPFNPEVAPQVIVTPPSTVDTLPDQTEAPALPVKDGRKVIGLTEKDPQKALSRLKTVNSVSPDWQEKLEETLRAQGGDDLKEIKIQKVESLILHRNGHAFNTESVVVTLKNNQSEVSKFRAMIDSQTGQILETWDRPLSDPINPREEFKLKVDPRYNLDQ